MTTSLKRKVTAPAMPVIHTTTPAAFDLMADSGFIRLADMVKTPKNPSAPVPFSPATCWRKVADGSFPKPIKLSERVTCWRVADIRGWMLTQVEGGAS